MAFYNGLLGHKEDCQEKNVYEANKFWWKTYMKPTSFGVCIEIMWCQQGLPDVQRQWRIELK